MGIPRSYKSSPCKPTPKRPLWKQKSTAWVFLTWCFSMRDLFLGIDAHSMLALPKQARTRFRPSFLLPLLVYSLLKNSLVDLVEKRAKPCAIVIAILYIIIGLTGLLPDLRYAQVDTTRMTHHRTEGVLFLNSETGLHRPGHCSSFLPCHSILSDPSIHPVSQPFVFYWSACEHLHTLTVKSQ